MDDRSPRGFLDASKGAWDRAGSAWTARRCQATRCCCGGAWPDESRGQLSRWSGLNWQGRQVRQARYRIPNEMLCGVDGGWDAQMRRRALLTLIAAETSAGTEQVPSRESYTGGIMGTLPWLGCVVWCGVVVVLHGRQRACERVSENLECKVDG